MTEARKRRELLPLIHHHLVQAGYVRAAREVKLQSGQKTFPAQSVTLLDIYTHWQQTSGVAKKRKAEEADGEFPYKVRVSDPTSSSESSEEETEQERVEKTMKTTKVLYSNSVSVVKDTQCKNSLSAPKENVKTKNKKGTSKTVVTSASHPDPLEAQTTFGKPGPTVSVKSHSKKSPAALRKQAAQPPSNSLTAHSEEKVASPVVKPVPKPAPMPPDKKTKSSSEDSSSDETDIEMEKAMGTPQGSSASVRGNSAALVPTKGSQVKVVTPSSGRLVTKPLTAKEKNPEETSESSDESESDEDAPWPQQQTQEVKMPSLGKVPGRVGKTTPTTEKTITPSSKLNLGLPSKAAETRKPEESSESSDESESEEEAATLQRQQVKTAPASGTKVSPGKGKGALPVPGNSVTSNLQTKAAKPGSPETSSESSEESESDEEASVSQGQEKSSLKTPPASAIAANRSPAHSSLTKVPLGKGTLQAQKGPSAKSSESSFLETSSDSSEDSESKDDIVEPQRQENSSGKAPQANATPVKGTILAPGKAVTSAPQARTRPLAPQARTGLPTMTSEPGSSESSSESSEESESEEEIKAPQEKEKSLMKAPQVNAITKKVAPAPTQGPLRKEALSAPVKSGTLASGVKAPSTAEASGSDNSESSEESDSEEETPPILQTQVKPPGKIVKATPAPPPKSPLEKGALHTPGKTVTSAPSAKVTSPAKGVRPGGSEESSESSEESESEVETPPSQGQVRSLKGKETAELEAVSSVKTPQVKTSPSTTAKRPLGKGALPTSGKLVTTASTAKGTSVTKAVGPRKPEESSESSEETDSEDEVPVTQGQTKPVGKASQVNTSQQKSAPVTPVSSKGTQGRVSTPAPWKAGTVALQAKAARHGKPKDTSESSEESESEEESPASQRQGKPAKQTPQADTPSGKGTSISPVSTKGSQGKASAPSPLKSGTVPLQAKGEVQVKTAWLGRPEETSKSSEDPEWEGSIPVSQGQVKPAVKISPGLEGEKGTTTSSPKKSAVASLQTTKVVDSSSSEESSSSSDDVVIPASPKQVKPSVQTPLGKAAEKPVALLTTVEETSSDSSEGTESEEEEVPAPQGQVKTTVKSTRVNTASGKCLSSSQTTITGPVRPEKNSDSSEESKSEDEVVLVFPGQIKPTVKTPEVTAASSSKQEPTPASRKSETPSPQTQVRPQTKVTGTAASEESSDSSDESESEVVISVPQKQVSSGTKDDKAGTAKNNMGKMSRSSPDKQVGLPEISQKSERSNGEPPTAQVIKTPLIFVDPSRSPAGKAVVPMKARTASRKRQVSESREQSSSESEDNDVIPDTQHPTLPTAPICQKANCPPSTSHPEDSMEESTSESASEDQGTGTSQTTCVKSKTAKQDKKSKLSGGTEATAAQDSFSVSTSNGTRNEKEDPVAVRVNQTQNLGLSPAKGKVAVKTESPEDSSEEEMIEPSQSILSAYAFPSSSLPISINPQLQKASPKQRLAAIASAGSALPASFKENPQGDSSDSEAECKTESVEQPLKTGKELKTPVSRRQTIRKGFKPGAVNCKPTSPKQGITCLSPIKTMAPSNLPLIQLQILSANENSELNNASFNSKASGMKILSDLPQLEKKRKGESPKSGKGSKKSKSKRKLTEEGPKAPKSKKKKLMSEVPKEGEACPPKVGKKEKASGDAKEKKLKEVLSSKKNKDKLEENSTITVGESGETLGTKTKKEKKQKKKSDKKKKDKKKKKKKSISKDADPASASLKKEKKRQKKVKQVN
ncbi:treacle protein [Dromiciops gliroides]|uniref:treacle protein n=1 Tax=Dromiciops gliroides TaxID=33562 RepID=UPI001CC6DBFA|nr:treacle protein [Dromiciops gliroides]